MGRSEHIDTSHKQMQGDVFDHYSLENIQKREQLFTKNCDECGELFNTKIEASQHCGGCSNVANVLYIHYMTLAHRWNVIVANPNRIVERVFNQQVKKFRRLTQNG